MKEHPRIRDLLSLLFTLIIVSILITGCIDPGGGDGNSMDSLNNRPDAVATAEFGAQQLEIQLTAIASHNSNCDPGSSCDPNP
jgi:hypothetical protein